MKSRNFTLTLLMLLSFLSLRAQEADGIMPFLQEGKTWNCYNGRFQRDEKFFIKGDTTCFGMECKKMYHEVEGNTTLFDVLYETDGKVYRVENNGTLSFVYDFSLNEGDFVDGMYTPPILEELKRYAEKRKEVYEDLLPRVEKVEWITVRGRKYKKMVIHEMESTQTTWIAGIGTKTYPLYNSNTHIGCYLTLISCTLGDEVLFTADDFLTDVKSVKKGLHVVETYNAWGQRTGASTKGLNILRMSDGSVRKTMKR